MSRQTRISKATLARERALHLYASAIDRADLDTMEQIRQLAEHDPLLAQGIEELEELDAATFPELAMEEDAALVRELLARHLPSGSSTWAEDAEDPPPLTVGIVVSKLIAERKVPQEDQAASLSLRDHQDPVPAQLGRKDTLRFGHALGVRMSERFWQLFREAALLLGLAHSRQVGFAAARRTARAAAGDDAASKPKAPAARKDEDP